MTGILQNATHIALGRQILNHLENDVLTRHPGTQRTGKHYANHTRGGQIEGPAAQRHSHINAAGTDGDHTNAAARRRV